MKAVRNLSVITLGWRLGQLSQKIEPRGVTVELGRFLKGHQWRLSEGLYCLKVNPEPMIHPSHIHHVFKRFQFDFKGDLKRVSFQAEILRLVALERT